MYLLVSKTSEFKHAEYCAKTVKILEDYLKRIGFHYSKKFHCWVDYDSRLSGGSGVEYQIIKIRELKEIKL